MLDMRFSIAPMMEWTDRHCRFFHRLLTRRARIYTEMITTAAVLYGDRARLLAYDPAEHPLALEAGCAAAEPPRGDPRSSRTKTSACAPTKLRASKSSGRDRVTTSLRLSLLNAF
jgi:hypothetical protein